MTVFPSESETDTTLEIPLQRFNIKVGRENEIANKVRQALVKNEYFSLDENGTELYYEIYGRGEHKILFINASGRSLDDYRHLISRFLDLNQFQMCTYDHRTTGMSKGKLQRLSTALLAQDIEKLIAHLQWGQVNIIAHSMGSFTALELLLHNPNYIQSGFLMGCSSGYWRPSFTTIGRTILQAFACSSKQQKEIEAPVSYSKQFLSEYQEDLQMTGLEYVCQDQEYSPICEENGSFLVSISEYRACMSHFVDEKGLEEVKQTNIPILIAHGTADNSVPFSHGQYVAKQIECEFYAVEGAGHNIFIEREEQIYNKIVDFLQRVSILNQKRKTKISDI